MRIFAVATNKKVCDNIYVTGFNLNVIKMIPAFMVNIVVKIPNVWTTLKIIVSKNPVGYTRFLRCNKQKSP